MANAMATLAKAAPKFAPSASTKKEYAALKKLTSSQTGWGKAINANLMKYDAIGDFDPAKSAYYQNAYNSLKQVYQNRGRQDMENTIAAAAANTGGYGNSYGTTAGNQAYQSRLASLAEQVPTLYGAATSEFSNRKENLANLIGMQQAQQQSAINNAQFQVGVQQALDEARYNAAVNRDNALRELAKLQLAYKK